jgi:hypothetical protein
MSNFFTLCDSLEVFLQNLIMQSVVLRDCGPFIGCSEGLGPCAQAIS